MATKRVHVYQADGEFRVHPPVIELDGTPGMGSGDKLEVVNHTTEDVVCYFEGGLLDVNPVSEPVKKGGGKSNQKKAHTQGAGNIKMGAYHVFMVQSGKKAKGNSDPMMIIEN